MGLVRCRQEVPFHWRGLNSRSYPHWQGHLHQDDPYHHHPQRLSALHPQVSCVQQYTFHHTWLTTVSLSDRYEKRHKNLAAHVSPAFRVELGDVVTVGMSTLPAPCVLRVHRHVVGQCRPLSKTVRFNVIRVAKNKASAKTFGKF